MNASAERSLRVLPAILHDQQGRLKQSVRMGNILNLCWIELVPKSAETDTDTNGTVRDENNSVPTQLNNPVANYASRTTAEGSIFNRFRIMI